MNKGFREKLRLGFSIPFLIMNIIYFMLSIGAKDWDKTVGYF